MDNAQIHMIEHDNHKTNRKARWRPTQEQRTVLGMHILYFLNVIRKFLANECIS